MCGIGVIVCDGCEVSFEMWDNEFHITEVLKKRGPDYQGTLEFQQNTFVHSSVLHLRGVSVTPQPLTDDQSSDSFLSWNGEIFSGAVDVGDQQNDGKLLFQALQAAAQLEDSSQAISETFSSVHGPFAFCYWQVREKRNFLDSDVVLG